jgi:hypothetical protein
MANEDVILLCDKCHARLTAGLPGMPDNAEIRRGCLGYLFGVEVRYVPDPSLCLLAPSHIGGSVALMHALRTKEDRNAEYH